MNTKKTIKLLLVTIFVYSTAQSQDSLKLIKVIIHPKVIIDLGVGGGFKGITGKMSIGYIFNNNIGMSMNYTVNSFKAINEPSDYQPAGSILGTGKKKIYDNTSFYSLLFNDYRTIRTEKIRFTVGVGPSLNVYSINKFTPHQGNNGMFVWSSNYDIVTETKTSFGLSVQSGINRMLNKKFALGGSLFGNFNSYNNYFGCEANFLVLLF